MVYSLTLPTTSYLSFQTFLSSSTHPSLPQFASTARNSLRLALKAHRRLPRSQQDSHLSTLLAALDDYLPILGTISQCLNGKQPRLSSGGNEDIEIILYGALETKWRPTLPSTSPLKSRHSPSRIRGQGIDYEIAFVVSTLGYVLSNLARSSATLTFYAASTPTPDQRTAAVQSACRYLLKASAAHSLLASSAIFADLARVIRLRSGVAVPDLDPAAQAALSSLSLAEATLLAVWKDDAHIAACIQARNPNDRDWMIRAPEIPKVRALLFARLCVRSAEYAEQAAGGLEAICGGGAATRIDDDLIKYTRVLGRVARARACRFLGIDAELAGKVGEGIAWLQAARMTLGLRSLTKEKDELSTMSGLSKLRKGWVERREERKMEKDSGSLGREKGEFGPGDNAGREEESRVIDLLEAKWTKMNDTINTQHIPLPTNLLANMPSGRDIHSPPGSYKLPCLDETQLARMRAPPEDNDIRLDSDDSEEEYSSGVYPETTGSAYY